MNATPHPLDSLIAEVRERLARAEAEARDARIEIAALEKAKVIVPAPANQTRRRNARQKQFTPRRRSLSEGWQKVLRSIRRKGESDLDLILGFCEAAGLSITRESLRSQMFNYVKRGYLERMREGVFRLTAEGEKVAAPGMPSGDTGAPPSEGEAP